VDDKQRFDLALVENIQRENLDPIEEAKAFKRLIEEFQHTHEQVAEIVGKERSVISNALRLLSLPEEIQLLISEGKMSPGHGKILAGMEDVGKINDLAIQIVNDKLSVRAVEKLVSGSDVDRKIVKQEKQEVELVHLKEELQRKFGTKAKVSGSSKKGKIEIFYYSLLDLERILRELRINCG
jgi:ParB family chromosome partitioning protein